ncbi:MAG: Ig-like domain-containing protein, partial [Bacteroidota bacterium]|nr:Ig-like domain-containing protein [Bacteroidota bacterium]
MAFGTNYHIAVKGSSSGDGSQSKPWDIETALSGSKGSPGDTLWLHGGVYKGNFKSNLRGTSSANIVVAQFPGELAILDGANKGRSSVVLNIWGQYTTYYGFTVTNSSSKRYSSQSGSSPPDIESSTGIDVTGPNIKLINLIVRDNIGVGIGFWKGAVNSELYGNIIYNNGFQGSDRGHGPGIYAQNESGIKQIKDNIIFGGFGRGIQIYGVNGGLTGFNIDGNTFFNNGLLSNGTTSMIIGGESASDNVTFKNNNTYKDASGNGSKGINLQIHYGSGANGKIVIENNNLVGGENILSFKSWEQIHFNRNNIIAENKIIDFNAPGGNVSGYTWNNNTYTTSNSSNAMDGLTFDNWKKWYGFDSNSKYGSSSQDNQIIIKPNTYVKDNGHVVIYNHQRLSSVDVDISRIVANGAEYEIYDVENITGQAIITGKYSGGTVRLPMNLTTTAKPNGVSSVPHSDQGFGVFIVRTKGKASGTSPVIASNKQPTLSTISNPAAINEDASEQTINLSGITAGEGETQKLTITASSSNPTFVPNPTVVYTSPNNTGSIKLKPAANRSGKATITVTVNDGQKSNNTISRTFEVTVNPINDAPTLNALGNVTVAGNSETQTINLAGITAGPFENQALTVTASSSNTSLIPNPYVVYTSPNATGSIKFATASNQSGTATITVRITDNGSGTAPNVNTFTRTFTVTVGAISNKPPTLNNINNTTAINEDAPEQTINLSGISAGEGETQKLTVTATSSNTTLIPNPSVQYISPNAIGTLKYKPAANRSGKATITVTVNDGQSSNNTIARIFEVTVNPINDAPTLNSISNLSVEGNSGSITVDLAGITAGPFEDQALTVTATSNNTG